MKNYRFIAEGEKEELCWFYKITPPLIRTLFNHFQWSCHEGILGQRFTLDHAVHFLIRAVKSVTGYTTAGNRITLINTNVIL